MLANRASDHNALPKLQNSPSVPIRRGNSIACETAPDAGPLDRERCLLQSPLSRSRPVAEVIPPATQFPETFLHSRVGKVALLRLAGGDTERQSTATTAEGAKSHAVLHQVKRISCEFHRHADRYDTLRAKGVNTSQLNIDSLRKAIVSETTPSVSKERNADRAIPLMELIHSD